MNIIAAMTKDRVIGKDNSLPWHIPEEMKHFRKLTLGNTVIMGSKTFASMSSKPLPNRNNIVLSSSLRPTEGIDVCRTIQEAVEKAKSYGKEIFVIGGSSIYRQTIPLADKMYLSYIKKYYEGDTFFPAFDESEWEIETKEEHEAFDVVVYVRKAA